MANSVELKLCEIERFLDAILHNLVKAKRRVFQEILQI